MNIRFQPNTLYYDRLLGHHERTSPPDALTLSVSIRRSTPIKNTTLSSETAGYRSNRSIKAFDDMWHWDAESAQRVRDIKNAVANPASKVIAAFETIIPNCEKLSYTCYMAQRLFEMHRILKDTGSIYLHCDPTASHYLKLIMDAIFGDKNFRNEIVWFYDDAPGRATRWFPRKHDILLSYNKGRNLDI